MTHKEASRLRADGRIELTGAKDADGILVELSAYDIQRMGRAEVERYQEKRRRQIEAKKAEAEERRRFEEFQATFVKEGGTPAGARAAYTAMKDEEAGRAARLADETASHQQRAAAMGAL
jgi:hypothetical protein